MSLFPPLLYVSVPSQESERSCICVLEVMYLCGIDFASFNDLYFLLCDILCFPF